MKLSDYVAQTLAERGVRDLFLVSGGGIMHLLDSMGRHPDISYHATYHEQAAVVAAEGYARRTGRIGVALVTVGPGAANAVSGLPGAWVDSIPVIVLVGQVRQNIIADYRVARQYGPQEANTLDMARPVTKYAASVRDPVTVRRHIDLAFEHALSGRPGPVWLEFPLDVQGANVEPAALEPYTEPQKVDGGSHLISAAAEVATLLREHERPLIVGGNGVRLAHAEALLHELLRVTGIPAVLPITAKDLIAEDDPALIGVFGTAGQRRANFAVQNCDALLVLGGGLNLQKCGFNVDNFAPNATKILIDIDRQQLYEQALKPDVAVLGDVAPFLKELISQKRAKPARPSARWLAACAEWKRRYPVITPDYRLDTGYVNSYLFMDTLSDCVRASDTIVPGAGLDTVSAYQAFRVQRGQRVLISGWGSMGWDLPLSVGACVGSGARTITITGDGSIQWNVHELQTIAHSQLPIKIFVFNNSGFSSIRATQNNFFEGRFVGSHPQSGVSNPDFAKLASAYGLTHCRISTNEELPTGIVEFLADDVPGICEVVLDADQSISPKTSSFRRDDGTFESRPLEDMAPFLPREEVHYNMHLFDNPVTLK
jgi:acetolactate synthase-1/2/3 large subunit